MALLSPGDVRSRICALLAAAAIGVAPGSTQAGGLRAPSLISDHYSRSASWTSCRILRSRTGQRTLRGLLARQWIIGYISGARESELQAGGPSMRTSADVMNEVRYFCLDHPNGRAVDAAEGVRSDSAHWRGGQSPCKAGCRAPQ
jgi:hypothetical protein